MFVSSLFIALTHLFSAKLAAGALLAFPPLAAPSGSGGGDGGVGDAGGDDAGGADHSFEGAGRAFLESLPPEERDRPYGIDGGEDVDEGEGAEGRAPIAAEAVTGEGDDEEGDDEPIVRETDGATWNPKAQRWVKDKKFVEGAAPEGWEAPAAGEEEEEEETPPADGATPKDKTAAGAAAKIVLPGLADRGEEDLEIEIDDPEVAARLKRLQNDGLRRKDFNERMAQVDQREARVAAYQEAVRLDPIGFHLNQMPADQQLEVARALILEHYDALREDLQAFEQDPGARHERRVELRDRMRDTDQRVTKSQQMRDYATKCLRATEQLVPEQTEPARAQRFMRAARIALAEASDAGTRITPDNVNEVLKDLMQDYGFDRAAAPAPVRSQQSGERGARSESSDRREPPAARPVSDKARELATRGPTKAQASAAQSRIRRVQAQRSAGQRVVPPGAGAAPVQVPVIPPEAASDVASASKYLRQKGLPDTWAGVASR